MVRIFQSETAALGRMTRLQKMYPNRKFVVLKREFGHAVYIIVWKGHGRRYIPCA